MIPLFLAAAIALPQALPFHEMNLTAVDSLLAAPAWQEASLEERLRRLIGLRVGTPYELGCLGEEREPDADPIFRIDRADCTVLVMTDAALAHSDNLSAVEEAMVRIHYRDEKPTYENRHHFTTNRIFHSPWFAGITSEAAPDSLLDSLSLTLNRKDSGEKLLDLDWEREMTVRFLPSGRLTDEILERLPSVCGVAFVNVKNAESGYLVSHEGILLNGKTLHHASSAEGEVVNVDLLNYLVEGREKPRFDGLIFYRFL